MGSALGFLLIVLLAVSAAMFYFLPSFVAMARGHQNGTAILVLNLLLGWSFVGWVVALVWAFTQVRLTGDGFTSGKIPEPKRVLMIVSCVVVLSLLIIIGAFVLLSGTPSAPFIYTLE
jgi:Superinfection immunity protein